MIVGKGSEKQTAHYRSKDPIGNLRIKVSLKKLTVASIIPTTENTQSEADSVRQTSKEKFLELQKGSKTESEELIVQFNQKFFSHREVLEYSKLGENDILSNHHRELRNKCKEELSDDPNKRPNKKLFTFNNFAGDGFAQQFEIRPMTTDKNEEPSFLTRKMAELRMKDLKEEPLNNAKTANKQTSNGNRPNTAAEPASFMSGRIVVDEPDEELKEKNHYLKHSATTFHIMADLTAAGMEHLSENEHLLCTISLSSNGVISVNPDFNRHRPPYTVVADGERREVYEYTIEHVSKQITPKERVREQKVVNDIYLRHQQYKLKAVGDRFVLPDAGVLRVNCFGEIVSAKHFEYDGIYIQYYLDVPNCWWADEDCQITGVTQRCNSKVDTDGMSEVCFFGFPFDFELSFRNEDEDKDGIHSDWPTLFIEVLSIDQWLRFRTEGYGWVKLPAAPGVFETEVSCWRPLGSGAISTELRRFFVGGSPELEDIAYVTKPTTHEDGSVLSKYGFRTETTGTVKLRFNTVMQSQLFTQKGLSEKKRKSALSMIDRLGGHSMQATVQNVLEAFNKSRKNLRAAREGILLK